MTETLTVRNGIDVDQLLATIDAIKDDRTWRLSPSTRRARWQEGTHNIGEIGRFVHAGHEDQTRDEPLVLLGNNKGPNAVELLLQAVGFCYAVGHVANAAARGIEVTQMEYDIEGDVDVRTFLGLAGPRAGFTAIRVTGRVASPNATDEQLQELCTYVQDTSPVVDSLANPIPVTTTLQIAH